MTTSISEQINSLLPQTQCEACSYEGCKPYAEAIASGKDSIEKCEPGGRETLVKIAGLLNTDPEPYMQGVIAREKPPLLARIIGAECICFPDPMMASTGQA